MLSLLLCHLAVGVQVHSYRSPSSYVSGPTEREVPVTILMIAGSLWDSDHEHYVSRIALSVNIAPLFWRDVFPDLLHSVRNEGVEATCIVLDVCLNHPAIGPEHFF